MTGVRPKQHARIGIFHLEESILDVLLEQKHEGICIGPAQISRLAGIYRDRGDADSMNHAITAGMMVKLHSKGRVERCQQINGRGGWKLSDDEFNSRREDLKLKS